MKSDSTYVLAVCESFRREAESVAASGGFEDLSISVRPACCGRPPLAWGAIVRENGPVANAQRVAVLGGSCVRCMATSNPDPCRIMVCESKQCLYWLAAKVYVDDCQSKGLYVLSAGWLENWICHIETWALTNPWPAISSASP